MLVTPVPVAYAFAGRVNFEALRAGLERTLSRLPTLAGRLISTAAEGLCISCEQSPGALLEFADESSKDMPGDKAPCSAWERFFTGFSFLTVEPFDKPLLEARLTHCKNGSVLAIIVSHMVADGDAVTQVINTWNYETNRVVAAHSKPIVVVVARGAGSSTAAKTFVHANPAHASTDAATMNPVQPTCERTPPMDVVRQKFAKLPVAERAESVMTVAQILALSNLVVGKAFDDVTDFVFTSQHWDAIKAAASNGLGKGEWISSCTAYSTHAHTNTPTGRAQTRP